MGKIFYDHLIVIEEITAVLDSRGLTVKERQEILSLTDQTLHHHVLNVILTHLPREHHKSFLTRFHQAPHDETLLTFLKEKVTVDIEKEIVNEAQKVKKEIIALIGETGEKP